MKKSIFFVLAALLFASCEIKVNPDMEELMEEHQKSNKNQNVELTKSFFEAFNQHDWDKVMSFYADKVDIKDPSLGSAIAKQSQEEILAKYKEIHGLFPNIKDEVSKIYPSGKNTIIVEFISSGNAQDGSEIVLPICTIFTFKDGKIVKDYTYFDNSVGQ
jgi:ketosteroid isomerase-like protein